MADRISVEMALELFVDDEQEMRTAGFERLKAAWSSDEDFPYEDAAAVPLEVVVNSLLADALPLQMPGCRRGRLEVDAAGLRHLDADADSDSDGDADEDATDTDTDGGSDSAPDAGSRRTE